MNQQTQETYQEKVKRILREARETHDRNAHSSHACGPVEDYEYEALERNGLLRPPAREA